MPEAVLPAGWPAMSLVEAERRLTAPGAPFEIEEKLIRGQKLRVWKNAPPTLGATLEAARVYSDRVFLVYEDERVTFEAFRRAVAAFARELQAQGVTKGDRVAVVMRNLPEWVVAFYATVALGAIATPLNAWWTGAELEYGLADSGAKVLVADAERYGRLAGHLEACPDLARIYVSRQSGEIADPRSTRLEAVIGEPAGWADLPDRPLPAAEVGPEDEATIFYTSGTTGRPKGALGTHRAVNSNIMASAFSTARSYLRRGEAPPPTGLDAPQRACLISIPLFHVTGCFAVLNPLLAGGGKLVMMRRWEPERAFQLIEREKIQQAGGVPTVAWQLLEHPARARHDLTSLESIAYGGAPAAPELVRKIRQELPTAFPGIGWGMTETCATVTNHTAEDYLARPDSAGPPVAVSDLKIVDPVDGVTELATGELGELWARGPQIVKGYWNKPQATAETLVEGWLRTGDLARLDEEGFLYIVDRAKDMLIRGGENIYCIEVENALYAHPAVMDAAVVGMAHRTLGEEPVAVVTLKPGATATEEELRAHAARTLAAFKVPVAIRFWPEPLPRNANGKILKGELKALFAEAQAGA